MALPFLAITGLGGIFAGVLEWLSKIFVKSKFFRILVSVGLMEVLYISLNSGIQFFINYLSGYLQGLAIPSEICWTLNNLDFFSILSFYVSVLISFAFMKYFLRMSERFI